ncbi:MAG: ferrochelatase [Proteobacteria bacterium]|nr:ferrochelatase [Pseudomonadota bacterium]MBU1710877.1 ferrochelatase [Pseudomonadota bacterium]
MKSAKEEVIGVVLLNLGGPERLEEVEPFLFNLFSDRKIIRLSPFAFLQKFIARKIARKRAPKSAQAYKLIGGGSPLNRITGEQGKALEVSLAEHGVFKVGMAMRYWKPYAGEILADFAGQGIHRIIALTLYPHYSKATTGSSIDDLMGVAAGFKEPFEISTVESYPDHQGYVKALAGTIGEGIRRFGGEKFQVVYSAHSLPVNFIKEGDPYVDHLVKTIRAVEKSTNLTGKLCYQSRSGPVEWLSPSTPEMLEALAAEGCSNVLMVPISFVSDHVETLYEIDMLYKDQARDLGIRLERTESLNTNPVFINALKDLVLSAKGKPEEESS